ncbi:hypothetical protein F2P81_008654 [Scophthalmus maximus]|uniref:Uncharacterized protein n=1 Tax=Scophthalmus maximus TaxID=52904 RepID=A0A6A4T2A7_SCOMX|nr:hypothetical protein F2P81_008654 [Scophthalmus maximus]
MELLTRADHTAHHHTHKVHRRPEPIYLLSGPGQPSDLRSVTGAHGRDPGSAKSTRSLVPSTPLTQIRDVVLWRPLGTKQGPEDAPVNARFLQRGSIWDERREASRCRDVVDGTVSSGRRY